MKRGQSAMEFLMTYGWAILVVLIALGALFYLGVFSPTTPSTCSLQAPFVCKDFAVRDNGVVFSVGSSNILSGVVTGIDVNGEDCFIFDGNLNNNQVTNVECVVDLDEDDKVSANIQIDYNMRSGLTHSIEGEGNGNKEEGAITGHVPVNENNLLAFNFEGDDDVICGENEDECPAFIEDGGIVGDAFEFDGVNDYFVTELTNAYIQNDFAIGVWVYPENAPGVGEHQGIIGRIDPQLDGIMFGTDSNMRIYYRTATASGTTTASFTVGAINLDEWTMLTFQYDVSEGDLHYYKNGAFVETDDIGTPMNTDNLKVWIGKFPFAIEPHWDGSIDEIRVWNRNLEENEIQAYYLMGRG